MTLRVGIVGTGRMAHAMAAAMVRHPAVEVVAVASESRARAEAFARTFGVSGGIAAAHEGRAALLARDGIDLVYVANRSRDHAASSIEALRSGRAVLCEKPFALSEAEAVEVTEAARAAGRFLVEGFWTMLLPSWAELVRIARSGDLGAARHLSFSFGYPSDPADRPAEADGGLAFNRAGYGVMLACAALGPPDGVEVTGTDPLSIAMRHAGGLSEVAVSARALLANAATLGCEGGLAALEPPVIGAERLSVRRTGVVRMAPAGGAQGLRQRLRARPALRRLAALRAGPRVRHMGYGAGLYDPMLSHVAARIAGGHLASDVVTHDLSLHCARVLAQVPRA